MTSTPPDDPRPADFGSAGYGLPPQYAAPPAPYWSMPGAGPGWDGEKPSQAMSIWALVLSCLFVFPVAVLVGIGLAIAVLARSNAFLDYGRKKAVAALVIGGLVIVGWVALVVALVVAGTVTTSGSVTSAGGPVRLRVVEWDQLKVGECFDQTTPLRRGEVTSVQSMQVVPCAASHEFEVYAQYGLREATYPGRAAIRREAGLGCSERFASFVGVPASRSSLVSVSYYSTPRGWGEGHHEVRCAVGPGRGKQISGTVRGSRR